MRLVVSARQHLARLLRRGEEVDRSRVWCAGRGHHRRQVVVWRCWSDSLAATSRKRRARARQTWGPDRRARRRDVPQSEWRMRPLPRHAEGPGSRGPNPDVSVVVPPIGASSTNYTRPRGEWLGSPQAHAGWPAHHRATGHSQRDRWRTKRTFDADPGQGDVIAPWIDAGCPIPGRGGPSDHVVLPAWPRRQLPNRHDR
jgi:hypothetical protein